MTPDIAAGAFLLFFILIGFGAVVGLGAFLLVKGHGKLARADRNREIERDLIEAQRDAAAQRTASQKLLPKLKRDGRL
ncbi:hypothetical protein [Rathayibacter festucae]|uniref:Uncharacterized protein n=1 Tax=Rathayibacter festucae DSM 15932 TaxID=1328866 RepID=A0A3T0SYK0_9MICO|nr:hypothetical protein [Rathayibacter festucae]AZZ51441.1 hypothetical protein C1I64_04880 [Rathayibacter festucae DSM 15932]